MFPFCSYVVGGYILKNWRLDLIIRTASETGFTIDYLECLSSGLSRQACLRLMGNASSMPSYMKSSDNPNVLRKASPPSRDKR